MAFLNGRILVESQHVGTLAILDGRILVEKIDMHGMTRDFEQVSLSLASVCYGQFRSMTGLHFKKEGILQLSYKCILYSIRSTLIGTWQCIGCSDNNFQKCGCILEPVKKFGYHESHCLFQYTK